LREGVYSHDRLFRLALDQALCLQSMLLRRSVIATHPFVSGIICADFSLALRLASDPKVGDGYYIKERVFKYRIHGDQITSSVQKAKLLESKIAAYEGCSSVPADVSRDFRSGLADAYLSLALLEAEARDKQAVGHALRSLRLAPGPRRAAGVALATLLPWAVTPARRLRSALFNRA
jgi:hypothetical protein